MERFLYLPNTKSEYFFCMVCLTNVKERYDNFKLQKKTFQLYLHMMQLPPMQRIFMKNVQKLILMKISIIKKVEKLYGYQISIYLNIF